MWPSWTCTHGSSPMTQSAHNSLVSYFLFTLSSVLYTAIEFQLIAAVPVCH